MRFLINVILLCLLTSCQSQTTVKKKFLCGRYSVEIELPEIVKIQEHKFVEGKTTMLTTKDTVVIEFYCGGNYIPHISNRKRYKILSENNNFSKGIDLETNLYWRKDGRLIYSNCKASDTAYYNKIFNKKIIKK